MRRLEPAADLRTFTGRFPGDSLDSSTWVMSVKGSVLAAYAARTLTREEALKQVDVKEQ